MSENPILAAVEDALSSSGGSDASEGSGGSGGHPLHRRIELPEDVHEDGAALLCEVREWLERHVIVMQPGDLDVLTLWAAHTHMSERLYSTPRLQIDSAVPGSGKTTVLEHLERLTFRAVNAASLSSPALLARLVAEEPRTLLLDEVDRTLDPKKEGVGELLAILNSGYKRGGSRPTLLPVKGGGWEAAELSTFAPVAMAGNQPNLPDDTRTRIIRVLLLPDWEGRAEESDWEAKEVEASTLGARLARWARHADVSHRPQMPEGVTGRFREKWQPLARVAHAAGGHWLERVLALAARDVEQARVDREEGLAVEKPHVVLLRHILEPEVWPEDTPFMRTQELVNALVLHHPETWGAESSYGKDLTAQRLGRMLTNAFSVRSTVLDRANKNSPRGYRRDQFRAASTALTPTSGGSPAVHTTTLPEPPERPEPPEPPEPTPPQRPSPGVRPTPTGPTCPECGELLTDPGALTRCRPKHGRCFDCGAPVTTPGDTVCARHEREPLDDDETLL